MNQTISETLYHFTDLESLKLILSSSEFHVKLNEVSWHPPSLQGGFHFYIPMACFCETPLGFTRDHRGYFGDYGIGMKIQWAVSKGLNNVIYTDMMNPNLHSEMISSLLTHYHDRAVPTRFKHQRNLNDKLVGSTELMVHRQEREWRYIGEITSYTNYPDYPFTPRSLPFLLANVDSIICPDADKLDLEAYLSANTLEDYIPLIIPPE